MAPTLLFLVGRPIWHTCRNTDYFFGIIEPQRVPILNSSNSARLLCWRVFGFSLPFGSCSGWSDFWSLPHTPVALTIRIEAQDVASLLLKPHNQQSAWSS